jgi:D-arabinose 1-dehydrogenase-like Zn-dependent alcohol dehydrogenase
MHTRAGGLVAIQGLGGLGHLALQYSRKLGYRTVALSSSSAKKDFAHELGATDYIDASSEDTVAVLNKMGGADLIVCTAPNPKVVGSLETALAPLGKLLVVALAGEVPVNTISLITKGNSVHGWPSGSSVDSQDAITTAQTQGIKCMIEKFKFEEAQEAVDHMLSGKARFRAVLTME